MSAAIADHQLGDVEARYLAEAYEVSRGLTATVRGRFTSEVAEMLSERPAAASIEQLQEDLGFPNELLAEFRAEHGLAPRSSMWERWRSQPRGLRLTQTVVALLVLGSSVGVYRYFTATPGLWNYCGGVLGTEVESSTAGGFTEDRVGFRQDERLGLFVCIGADTPGVSIDHIWADVPSRMAFQPVGLETDLTGRGELVGDASAFESFDPHEQVSNQSILWFEMEYCNIEGAIGFDSVHVDYRYRGRQRTLDLPLGYQAMVDGRERCTRQVRQATELETKAWSDVVRPELQGVFLERLGPLRLDPEAVSRDLCRYLSGINPIIGDDGEAIFADFEALSARAVFHLRSAAVAEALIDGAVQGICPEFGAGREDLKALLRSESLADAE